MPLIVITGIPCSGKTTRANELKNYFEKQGKEVHLISEYEQILKANFEKNNAYFEAAKEKHIRGLLKSEVIRLIKSQNVVILDGLNYIKGYRYELYCATKANKSTQCTVHAEINRDQARKWNETRENEKYNTETFDALVMRYEEPNGQNRWDSPLFMVFPDQTLDIEGIDASLFKKKPPAPNMSTQNAPLASTNFLYDLDKTTKGIVDNLVKAKNMGRDGLIKVENYKDLSVDVSNASIPQLMTLRRQYIVYSKMHPPDPQQIPQLFVQYLNTSLKSF